MNKNSKKREQTPELELFHEHMALALETGMPLSKGMRKLAGQVRSFGFRKSLHRLAADLEEGQSLADCLALEKKYFPSDYVALVRMGEIGGNLRQGLDMAIETSLFQKRFKDRMQKAIMYPLLIFLIICGAYVIAIGAFYPLIIDINRASASEIPPSGYLAYNIFTWLGQYGFWVLLALAVLVLILRTENVKKYVHAMGLRLPWLGNIIKARFIASFSESLSMLLHGGIPLPEAMDTAAEVTMNKSLRERLKKATARLREGEALEKVLGSMNVFPSLYLAAISMGQDAGALPKSLSVMAETYKNQTEYKSRLYFRILEVSLISLVGIWVAFILVALFSTYIDLCSNTINTMTIW